MLIEGNKVMQGLLKRNRPDIVGNIVQKIQYGHCMQHFIVIIFSMILNKKTELFVILA